AEPAERRKARPPQRRTNARASASTETGIRARLRKDSVLFAMCVAFLGFVTWACALTWWVTGAIRPLAVAVASVLPSLYLFYLRDG
ncbi:MAG TPA: hypothetical protein VFG86_03075, partial [Chloroflexota bacterium]|nr:hypothetical protein [Chloroflexota bacterium]